MNEFLAFCLMQIMQLIIAFLGFAVITSVFWVPMMLGYFLIVKPIKNR